MPHIYLIRLNGEPKYVGYTKNCIEKRWSEHLSAARTGWPQLLYRAIRKHGEQSFTIESIMEHEDAQYLRDVMEPKFIREYNTMANIGKGYNLTEGGEGSIGWIPSEETKKKISKANTGKKRSEEVKNRLSELKKGVVPWMKGKSHSEEAKTKMSVAKKGKPSPKKGKPGKPHSEETKRKMSEAHSKRISLIA